MSGEKDLDEREQEEEVVDAATGGPRFGSVAGDPELDALRSAKGDLMARMFGERAAGPVIANLQFQGVAARVPVRRAKIRIPSDHNIVGMGYGRKRVLGKSVGDRAVRVYVRRKLNEAELTRAERVPSRLNGYPTDVIQVGTVMALGSPGSSVGHHAGGAGTLGAYVSVGQNGAHVLSSSHVIARCGQCQFHDDVYQPGPADGGAAPPFAKLVRWTSVSFAAGAENRVDAAIALPLVAPAQTGLPGLGPVTPAPAGANASENQRVAKFGKRTQLTTGVVGDNDSEAWVSIGGSLAYFVNQIAVDTEQGVFADVGDSGSLVVDADHVYPVGLVCAGGDGGSTVFINNINAVCAALGITVP
jgi:hypothetical protein